jgi:hypothetical protein
MRFLIDLWPAILASGFGVFVMSALCWTVLPNHKKEFAAHPAEDAVMNALRSGNPPPGRYVVPWMGEGELMKTPEGKAKVENGPIAFITIAPRGLPNMGRMMGLSFLSSLVISVFVGYVAWHAIPPDAEYLTVFRIAGTLTFMANALGYMAESVWFARPWKSFAIQCFDSLLYAGVAGGIFGWLWP